MPHEGFNFQVKYETWALDSGLVCLGSRYVVLVEHSLKHATLHVVDGRLILISVNILFMRLRTILLLLLFVG